MTNFGSLTGQEKHNKFKYSILPDHFNEVVAAYYYVHTFFFFFLINNGIVLKRSPSTPGVNMENSTSNT